MAQGFVMGMASISASMRPTTPQRNSCLVRRDCLIVQRWERSRDRYRLPVFTNSRSARGNPWLRLLRREVEELVVTTHGVGHLKNLQAKKELAGVNREFKKLRTQVAALERRRAELLAELGD